MTVIVNPSRYEVTGGGNGLLTDLVSFWKFDEASGTRVDSHGSNDLTERNGTITSTTGIQGDAMNIDTDAEYIKVDSILTTNVFSVAFWAKDITTLNFDRLLIIRPGGAHTAEGLLMATESSTMVDFAPRNGDSYGITNSTPVHNYFTHASSGTWRFFVVTYNGYNDVKAYMDTSTTTPATGATWIDDNGTGVSIGASITGNRGGKMAIDSLSIWADRILSASDITALYNSGSGLDYEDFD